MTSPTPYQLLPRLSDDEYAALRDDVASNGIRVPIDVDEAGTILDGHHRAWIAGDLNIECPQRIVVGLTDEQKRTHAIAVNVHRRNLTREQRRELVARLRGDGMSVRRIAGTVGVPRSTVADDLGQLSETGQLRQPDRITGADGKSRPATVTLTTTERETFSVDTATGEIDPPTSVPAQPRRTRTDVVREMNLAIKCMEDAAVHAAVIKPEHLAHRNEEAAVWDRRLSTALAEIQRLSDALQEASQ